MENEEHCDFKKLRSLLIRTYMLDLTTSTEETHYESYRLAQMETRKYGEAKVKKIDNPKFKEEEEMLRKRFTEQVKLEESRFRQWEQHVRCKRSAGASPCGPSPRVDIPQEDGVELTTYPTADCREGPTEQGSRISPYCHQGPRGESAPCSLMGWRMSQD